MRRALHRRLTPSHPLHRLGDGWCDGGWRNRHACPTDPAAACPAANYTAANYRASSVRAASTESTTQLLRWGLMMGGATSSDAMFVIGISASGVLIATLVGLWIKYRADKRKKNGEGK